MADLKKKKPRVEKIGELPQYLYVVMNGNQMREGVWAGNPEARQNPWRACISEPEESQFIVATANRFAGLFLAESHRKRFRWGKCKKTAKPDIGSCKKKKEKTDITHDKIMIPEWYGEIRDDKKYIVCIDTYALPDEAWITDMRDGGDAKNKKWDEKISVFARKHALVLIEYGIPPEAMRGCFMTEMVDVGRRDCTFEQFVECMPFKTSVTLDAWLQDLVPPNVCHDASRSQACDYFASGAHKDVYKGMFTRGQRAGHPVVIKEAKEGFPTDAFFWQQDLEAVDKADSIIVAWNKMILKRCREKREFAEDKSFWGTESADVTCGKDGRTRRRKKKELECTPCDTDINGNALKKVAKCYMTKPSVVVELDGPKKGLTVLAEPLINGYAKWNSNSGFAAEDADYMQALSHFSYDYTKGKALLCDLQGGRYAKAFVLTDPVLMSPAKKYGPTDLGQQGIDNFFFHHTCGEFCQKGWSRPDNARPLFEPKKGSSLLVGGKLYGTKKFRKEDYDQTVDEFGNTAFIPKDGKGKGKKKSKQDDFAIKLAAINEGNEDDWN